MRAISMTIRNFLSFGEAKVRLSKRGIVLIEGENHDDPTARSNGAAKSAFVEAFVWCTQGITLRGYEGDDVINRKVGKNCRVAIKWKERKTKWLVIRTRHDDQLKTSLNLYQDGTRVTGSTTADTQVMIDRLLGMTSKTFLSSVVFGQTNAYRFSTLTDKEQKAILDEALGIEAYAAAGVAARDEANTHRVNIETLTREVEAQLRAIDECEVQIEKHTKARNSFNDDRAARCADLSVSIDALVKKLATKPGYDEAYLKRARDEQREEVKFAEKAVRELAEAHRTAKTEFSIAENAWKTRQDNYNRFEKLNEGDCPTCMQEIAPKHAQSVGRELAELADEADRRRRATAGLVERATDELAAGDAVVRKRRKKLEEIEEQLTKANEEATKRATRQATLDEQRKQLERENATKNPYTELRKEAIKKRGELNDEHLATLADLKDEETKLAQCEFWTEAFGAKGLRSLLIDTALPILNENVDRYARAITDGNIRIEFKTQTELKSGKTAEKFEVAVTNAHGAASYKGNSAGEKAKIDLCVGLALQALVASRAKSSINVAFFDEPFESLDDAAIERVAMLLTEELTNRESVFVITHQETLKAFFPNVMTVIKKKGMSHVE